MRPSGGGKRGAPAGGGAICLLSFRLSELFLFIGLLGGELFYYLLLLPERKRNEVRFCKVCFFIAAVARKQGKAGIVIEDIKMGCVNCDFCGSAA